MPPMLLPGGSSRTDIVADRIARRQVRGNMTECVVVIGDWQQRNSPSVNTVQLRRLLLIWVNFIRARDLDARERVIGAGLLQCHSIAETWCCLIPRGEGCEAPAFLERL